MITPQDLLDAAIALGFPMTALTCDPFAKYPRSDLRFPPGRLLVELRSTEGAPTHKTVLTKEQLLRAIAGIMPGLEVRKVRVQQQQMMVQQQLEAMRRAEAQKKGGGGGGGGGGGDGGSGKKKKK
jgi:hypothetical protein